MSHANEIRQLTGQFLEAFDTRVEAVAGIRTGTAEELAEFRVTRQTMATEQQQWLSNYMDKLYSNVDILRREAAAFVAELDTVHQAMSAELRQRLGEDRASLASDTEAFLEESDAAHQTMSAEQRQQLVEYTDELRSNVDTLRREAAAFVAELDAAHQSMSTELRQHLGKDRASLASDTAAFLEELDSTHQAMSAEQRQQLIGYIDTLRVDVNGLRLDAKTLVDELHAAHQMMAAQQQERLSTDRARLTSDVAAMRARLQAQRRELQRDLSEAQRVWGSFITLMEQRRARKRVARPPTPKEAAPPPPPVEEVAPPPAVEEAPPTEEVVPDDLTTIKGIGPKMQERLNQAGIYTFAQLAGSTAEGLRQAVGEEVSRIAKVEEWIEQAQELAG